MRVECGEIGLNLYASAELDGVTKLRVAESKERRKLRMLPE